MAKRLVRCIEGHIYDADAHSQCPTCGSRAQVEDANELTTGDEAAERTPADAAAKADDAATTVAATTAWQKWRLPGAAAGVVAVLALLWVSGVFQSVRKADETPAVMAEKDAQAGRAEQRKNDATDNDAPRKDTTKDTKKEDTKKETSTKEAAAKDTPGKDEPLKDRAGDDAKASAKPDNNDTIPPVARGEGADDCDKLAGSPDDPDKTQGVDGVKQLRDIKTTAAIAACEQATRRAPAERRFFTQLGRAYRSAGRNFDAATSYRTAADKGSAFAAHGLGQLYADGNGIAQNIAEARRYLRQSADSGLPLGMITYASLLYDKRATDMPDYAEARSWVERAAKTDFPEALNLHAYFLEQGWGGPKDMDGAIRNYEKAGKLGLAQAFFFLGQIAEEGRNGPRDRAAARKYYQQAADGGNLDGMRKLAELTLDSRAMPEQVEDARNMLRKAAEAGNTQSMWALGNYYDKGRFGEADPQTARRWWEKAAALGHTSAMVSLGFVHRTGKGVPRDYGEARRWYELAASKGSSAGTADLAVLYEFGLGVPQNYSEAWRLYDKAAAAGNTFAMVFLGGMIEAGKGLKPDNVEANRWYVKAWEAGNRDGQWRAATLGDRVGIQRNVPVIAKNMLEAARFGSDEAKTALFQNYNHAIKRDTREAIERILSERGFYNGPINGRFGSGVPQGLTAYMQSGN